MGCPLCPCFLSVRFHSSEGDGEAMQMKKGRKRRRRGKSGDGGTWESHLSVIGAGGTNNQYHYPSSGHVTDCPMNCPVLFNPQL